MPETTVGLQDNNLFGNLIANTRMSTNNSGSQTLNINSIQSDAKAEDVEYIENVDNMPFQEILGQHIFNLNIYNPFPNAHNGNPLPLPLFPFHKGRVNGASENEKGSMCSLINRSLKHTNYWHKTSLRKIKMALLFL